MDTKSLVYGLVGFFIGGFIVAMAATTINKPVTPMSTINTNKNTEMPMSQMAPTLANKTGDDYDKAFITEMIDHHESAVEMAKLSATNAKHDEIKQLSNEIVTAQEKEITMMRAWQIKWGYTATNDDADDNAHMMH